MGRSYTLSEDFPTPYSAIRELIRGGWNWKSRGVVIGLCGGFIAPIFGSILTVASWFIDPVWHGISLHQAGTSLFFVTLPLLILGAHCLDLLDKEKKSADTCRQLESSVARADERGH